ncbi:uncharacterized protein [Antedon mediterranea]|uniref:uncharacterized protein n=1 Tax=Antedon mediterranea TaxID=105859 RepID=UPI003AF5586F
MESDRPSAMPRHQRMRDLQLSRRADLWDVERAVRVRSGTQPVEVVGEIALFGDPTTYPTEREIGGLARNGCAVGLGVAPGCSPTTVQFDRLLALARTRDVRVIGRVGLDHSAPPTDWPRQDLLLKRVLGRCLDGRHHRILCLEVSGVQGDVAGEECHYRVLDILRLSRVSKEQRLLLADYASTEAVATAYLRHFPRTYFSVTSRVTGFTADQRKGLRFIATNEDRRLLMGSNGPDYPPAGYPVGAPHLLWATAVAVGQVSREAEDGATGMSHG